MNPRLYGELVSQVQVEPEPTPVRSERLASLRSGVRKHLQQAKIEQSIQSNKQRRAAPELKIGDMVLLATKNLLLATAY